MIVKKKNNVSMGLMTQVFFILMIVAMALTVLSLAAGIGVMAKGGEINNRFGNKLMRARVYFQGAALLFFVLAVATSAAS